MSRAAMDVPIDQLRNLPLEERLKLIEALWESVEADAGPPGISGEFADELDRRFHEHVADPASSIPWESVRAEIRRQLG